MRRIACAAVLVCVLGLSALAAPGLTSTETKRLMKAADAAAAGGDWDEVAELTRQLAASNKKKTWSFLAKLADSAPLHSPVPRALRDAAVAMDDKRVQKEVRKWASKSKSAEVRRQLVVYLASKGDMEVLEEALQDREERVAGAAAWHLVDAKTPEAVELLIGAMERLDDDQGGIWYILQDELHRLLGKRMDSGGAYRHHWEQLKAKGGLSAVEPEPEPEVAEGGSRTGLFGRSITSNRIVIILDTSGSMKKQDRSLRVDTGERGTPRRIERAKMELVRVMQNLAPHVRLNIIFFGSTVKMWRPGPGGEGEEGEAGAEPPTLHRLSEENRKDAIAWVEKNCRAVGATVTDEALRRAYAIPGAATLYLLSDGSPTDSKGGKVKPETIVALVDELDDDRHVVIHTLGFKGADKRMMWGLSEKTRGKYSDIR